MASRDSIRHARNFQDVTGQQFGSWTVLEFHSIAHDKSRWLCRCRCGTEKPVERYSLTSGKSKACTNCAKKTHGMARTQEYHIWACMRDRCCNVNNHSYVFYGGRGITVCERWLNSFVTFFDDMGIRPSLQHSIERIDNDGNYSCGHCEECLRNGWPANCCWATRPQQARNTSRNRLLTHNGQTMCLAAWAETLGINIVTLHSRLKAGWSVEKSLTTPVRVQNHLFTSNRRTYSLAEWAKRTGISYHTLAMRLRYGWSIEKTMTTPVSK